MTSVAGVVVIRWNQSGVLMLSTPTIRPWTWASICFAWVWLFGGSGAFSQPPADINNVFPLAPRELRQRLTRAQAALEEERYSDAVAEIGEVLNSTGSDDFFLG